MIDGRSYVRNGKKWPWHVEIIHRPPPGRSKTACGMWLDNHQTGLIEYSVEPDGLLCLKCVAACERVSGEDFYDGE